MKIFLNLVFTILLVGCQKADTKPQPSDCRVFRFKPEGKICISEQSLWLQTSAYELARNQINEDRWFNGIGANDAIFIPKTDSAEEIFLKCNSVNPLSADKASILSKMASRPYLRNPKYYPSPNTKKSESNPASEWRDFYTECNHIQSQRV